MLLLLPMLLLLLPMLLLLLLMLLLRRASTPMLGVLYKARKHTNLAAATDAIAEARKRTNVRCPLQGAQAHQSYTIAAAADGGAAAAV